MFTAIAPARRGPRKARAYRMRGARDVRHPRRLVLAHGCFTSRAQFLQRRQLIASGDGPSTSTELKARLFPEGSTAAAGRVLSRLSVSGPRENTRLNWPEQAAARTLPSGPLNDGSGQRLSKALTAAQYTAGKKPVKSYSRGPEWPYTRPAPIPPPEIGIALLHMSQYPIVLLLWHGGVLAGSPRSERFRLCVLKFEQSHERNVLCY